LQLIGPDALVDIGLDNASVETFGLSAAETIAVGRDHLGGDARFAVGHISERDGVFLDGLRRAGFAPEGAPSPVFERPTAGGLPHTTRTTSDFDVRTVRGEDEHANRAAAARRAFASTMEVEQHNARYLRFMRSPAYVAEHDVVAVTRDGRVAAFTIYWPDRELSLAQFEPVGADPDFQRQGAASAVIAYSLDRLAADGIERARVMTDATNERATHFYLSCGFEIVDRVGSWRAPA
jgi:ribosomal protein S18 acetylase RimI-like enzyme